MSGGVSNIYISLQALRLKILDLLLELGAVTIVITFQLLDFASPWNEEGKCLGGDLNSSPDTELTPTAESMLIL